MPTLAENRKELFDYEILEKYEAGVSLYGFEAKSVMRGSAQLKGAFVLIRGGEAHLINAVIPPYQAKNTPAWYEPDRSRKLLLHKKEIFLQYANRVVASRQKRQQVKCKLNFQSKERVCFGFRAFICFRESLIPFAIGLSDF